MQSNLNNPYLHHAAQSLAKEDEKMQLIINRIAKKIMRDRPNPKGWEINMQSLRMRPLP